MGRAPWRSIIVIEPLGATTRKNSSVPTDPQTHPGLIRDEDAPKRVLLADVADGARRAIAALVNSLAGVTLAGEVSSRGEVAEALRATRADVLVIDDRLLRPDGHAWSDWPTTLRVIVLGMTDEPAFSARARGLGAEAWVAKERADDELRHLLAA
jgi:DNA-binding NarL/FixJ family response regulator